MDTRPAGGFAAGTIPGAINCPAPDLCAADGALKGNDELKEIFTKAGVDPTKPMMISCGGGVMATVVNAAMR